MVNGSGGTAGAEMVDDLADRYRAPALDKGLDILELLAATEEGLSQAEIAKALDRTPNEIYRMLDRLVRRQYVMRTSGDRYELTLKLFALAHQHAPMRRLVSQAMPELRAFAREAGQACHLAIYDQGNVVVVGQVDSPGYWGMAIRVGSRVGLFNTGSGHVLLAFVTERERAFMMEEHELMPGELRPLALEERLAKVRQRGYELMPSQQTVGVQNLSVPVFGPNDTVVAALTCPYLTWTDPSLTPGVEGTIALLQATARRIGSAAGGPD
jgi:DNA-binding IclR family transcriptional regulator